MLPSNKPPPVLFCFQKSLSERPASNKLPKNLCQISFIYFFLFFVKSPLSLYRTEQTFFDKQNRSNPVQIF